MIEINVVTGKRLQTKDIPDQAMLGLIRKCTQMPYIFQSNKGIESSTYSTVNRLLLEAIWDNVPPKLILSKVGKLIDRGLVHGCACGCGGHFTLTENGRKYELELAIEEYQRKVASN